jgi:hypothetical protein
VVWGLGVTVISSLVFSAYLLFSPSTAKSVTTGMKTA